MKILDLRWHVLLEYPVCDFRWHLVEIMRYWYNVIVLLFAIDQLCDLYENDSIFDKFECCLSGDGLRVATGSYRSASYIWMIPWSLPLSWLIDCLHIAWYTFFYISATYFVCLVVLKEAQKQQHWKPARIQWGTFESELRRLVYLIIPEGFVSPNIQNSVSNTLDDHPLYVNWNWTWPCWFSDDSLAKLLFYVVNLCHELTGNRFKPRQGLLDLWALFPMVLGEVCICWRKFTASFLLFLLIISCGLT